MQKRSVTLVLILLHAYNHLKSGYPDEESLSRAERALREYYQRVNGRRDNQLCCKIIVTYAGKGAEMSFGEGMRAYLMSRGIKKEDIIFYPYGYNTAGEIEGAIKYLKNLTIIGLGQSEERAKIVSVSSFYHCPRIWYLWLWRKRWVRVRGCFFGVHWGSVAKEPLKIINSFLRPFNSKHLGGSS